MFRQIRNVAIRIVLLASLCSTSPLPAVPNTSNGEIVQSPRSNLLLDRGWKFHLGDASDPRDDFDYGLGASFAKAGDAVGAIRPEYVDSAWRTDDVPHDWAVEQAFVRVNDDDVKAHGYKPIGRQFPKTTIGWYRRSFVIPATDDGKRVAVKSDGVLERNSHLEWNVAYAPGTLEARGWRRGRVLGTRVESTGLPVAIQLTGLP